tara:strand:- start:99 stop:371 length:273 start_codon:yes stop_codon:yes gene_type:complete
LIEIVAAILGAAIGIAGMGLSGFNRRTSQSSEAIIRLSAGMENIATKLEDLHQDMKAEKVQASADRREIYERLNDHGNRITALESSNSRL